MWDTVAMWKAIPGYEGSYEVNRELFAVRSLDRIIVDSRGQYRRLRGRLLAGVGRNEFQVILSRNGIQTVYTLQEIIDLTFGAQIPA